MSARGTTPVEVFIALPGGPHMTASDSVFTQETEFDRETAMSDGTTTQPSQNAMKALAQFVASHRKGGAKPDIAQIEVPNTSTVDQPQALYEAAMNAVPVQTFSTADHASRTYMTQMMMPLPDQPRTGDRRRVRVADREGLLRSNGDTEPLTRPNGQTYLCRSLMGHSDKAALERARDRQINTLLSGPPGSGKTAVVDAVFDDLVAFSCHGEVTVANLVGAMQSTHDGSWVWVDGPLTIAVREGRPILLDEINRLQHDVQALIHPLTDGRNVLRLDDNPAEPVVHAKPGVFVVGTYNPDDLGSYPLTDALFSRFPLRISVNTDYGAARQLGVHTDLVTFAENLHTDAERAAQRGDEPMWVPQMRELLDAQRLIDAEFGMELAVNALIGACPIEDDRPELRRKAQSKFGFKPEPVALGEQIT